MKQTIHISGKVIFPLKEGTRAIIAYSGKLIQTKPVQKIYEISENTACFETENTIYRVSLISKAVVLQIPKTYAKCA